MVESRHISMMDFCNESWRPWPYDDNILVSTNGNVLKHYISKHGKDIWKLLSQYDQGSGYLCVSLGDYSTHPLVHRLVAETFIPNDDPDYKTEINHINGDKKDNRVGNLEWCSRSYNLRHAASTGLIKGKSVIVLETGIIYPSIAECARALHAHAGNVWKCLYEPDHHTVNGYRVMLMEDIDDD